MKLGICLFALVALLVNSTTASAESCPSSKGSSASEAVDFLGASPEEIALLGRNTFHENVSRIEEALNKRGTVLPQSGMITSQLRKALIAFQESVGIEADGQINRETLSRLGVEPRLTPNA